VLVVVNATPTPEYNYRLGVPVAGRWDELLNTDAGEYGGSGLGNLGGVSTAPLDSHDHHQSLVLTLPTLAAVALARSEP
jgi:1,4-alpha-glucan branching enzyme